MIKNVLEAFRNLWNIFRNVQKYSEIHRKCQEIIESLQKNFEKSIECLKLFEKDSERIWKII